MTTPHILSSSTKNKESVTRKRYVYSHNKAIPVYYNARKRNGSAFFQIIHSRKENKPVSTRIRVLLSIRGVKYWAEIPATVLFELYNERSKPRYPEVNTSRKDYEFGYSVI